MYLSLHLLLAVREFSLITGSAPTIVALVLMSVSLVNCAVASLGLAMVLRKRKRLLKIVRTEDYRAQSVFPSV